MLEEEQGTMGGVFFGKAVTQKGSMKNARSKYQTTPTYDVPRWLRLEFNVLSTRHRVCSVLIDRDALGSCTSCCSVYASYRCE